MHPFCRTLLTPALAVLLVGMAVRATAQTDPQPAEDEKLLKEVGARLDGPGLLEFFRKQIPTAADAKRVDILLGQLGDRAFKVREKAVVDLIALGPPALPGLRRVVKAAELETSRRAERCIEAIERRASPATVMAAARLLKLRRPEGACAVLLDYVPFAADLVADEVLDALFALGGRDGKLDPAVAAALNDPAPSRCAAAALVGGRFGTPAQRRAVAKLLDNDNLMVRFRAAQGLIAGRDQRAVPALLVLLAQAPLPLAEQAEDLLGRVAGEQAPQVFLGDDDKNRDKVRKAWDGWWQANKDKLDLAKADVAAPFASQASRARNVTRRFLEALIKGDLDAVQRTVDVPFAIDGFMVLGSRRELDDLFRKAAGNVKKQQFTFKVTAILRMDDYVKQTARPPAEFLKKVPKESLRAVIVDGREASGRTETAAVLVRLQGARVRVVGIGEARGLKK